MIYYRSAERPGRRKIMENDNLPSPKKQRNGPTRGIWCCAGLMLVLFLLIPFFLERSYTFYATDWSVDDNLEGVATIDNRYQVPYFQLRFKLRNTGHREAMVVYWLPNGSGQEQQPVTSPRLKPIQQDLTAKVCTFGDDAAFSNLSARVTGEPRKPERTVSCSYRFVYVVQNDKIIAERSFSELGLSLDNLFDRNDETMKTLNTKMESLLLELLKSE